MKYLAWHAFPALPICGQAKLIRCTAGAVYDVIIDLRPASPTYRQWFATELTAKNRRMIYVPEGFAHGAQTLADDTELLYMMSEFYAPLAADGVRWDDPVFGIAWPAPSTGSVSCLQYEQWPSYRP